MNGTPLLGRGKKERENRDRIVNIQKPRGPTVMSFFPLNYDSNGKTPKMKIVGFKKFYNFAFRPKFKRVTDLKLF